MFDSCCFKMLLQLLSVLIFYCFRVCCSRLCLLSEESSHLSPIDGSSAHSKCASQWSASEALLHHTHCIARHLFEYEKLLLEMRYDGDTLHLPLCSSSSMDFASSCISCCLLLKPTLCCSHPSQLLSKAAAVVKA